MRNSRGDLESHRWNVGPATPLLDANPSTTTTASCLFKLVSEQHHGLGFRSKRTLPIALRVVFDDGLAKFLNPNRVLLGKLNLRQMSIDRLWRRLPLSDACHCRAGKDNE
jgi:hypothetical protein